MNTEYYNEIKFSNREAQGSHCGPVIKTSSKLVFVINLNDGTSKVWSECDYPCGLSAYLLFLPHLKNHFYKHLK